MDALLAEIQPDDVSLCRALGTALKRLRGVDIASTDWNEAALEPFYRANLRVVDERGKLLAQGRDMSALIEQFRDSGAASSAAVSDSPAKAAVTRWDFGDLPTVWRSRAAGMEVQSYPALVDHGDRGSSGAL